MAKERTEHGKQVAELSSMIAMQTRIAEHAEARAVEAIKRSEELQEVHGRVMQEHADLQDQHDTLENALRDHGERLLAHSTKTDLLEAERKTQETRIEELMSSREQHIRAIEQTRIALLASAARAEEVESQLRQSQGQVVQLEDDLTEAKIGLESRTAEVDSLRQRLADVENSWAKSREEADQLRALTTGSLGELLDMHRDLKLDEDRTMRNHEEKITAMEEEVASLHILLKEAGQRADTAQRDLTQARKRVQDLEMEQMSLKSQIIGVRTQLQNAVADADRLRMTVVEKETELHDKAGIVSDAELRLAMFRNYFAERGEVIDEDDLKVKIGEAPARVVELENKLSARIRLQEEMEKELEQANRRRDELESHVRILSDQLDRGRSSQSPSSGNGEGTWETRALQAEQNIVESEKRYNAKLKQMEDDYQLAVKYVR